MFKSLLLGIDGSAAGGVAASLALDLAGLLRARLLAVHVDGRDGRAHLPSRDGGQGDFLALGEPRRQDLDPEALRRGRDRLEGIRRSARVAGLDCETRELRGPLLETLLVAARECDLVVLGRHGVSAEKRWHPEAGEVISGLLHRAELPVLVAGVVDEPLQRVVIGVDGGAAMRRVMASGVALASALSLPVQAWAIDRDTGRARHQLDAVARFGETHGVNIETHVTAGHPAETLASLAEEGDLLAIGAFGAGALHEWLSGSTTANLLARTSRAVLLHH
ncbi:universal stress protein [Halomonas maura]|uniref:universal stress protein n=1 Tax=Halomonas maura TaxID=117606 RepID=UPI0025B60E00|nr:universal stress protein [Halomonas maura]MDN3555020.1 universal stress protein [Halomonas maura]